MATQSQPPTTISSTDASQNQDLTQPVVENRNDVQAEVPKQISPPSVFVNSEPMREDQVQNAVNFLSHPKVRGSPVMYRRSFLEKKGLSREEIDEAFRRVPDPPPSAQTTGVNQELQKTSSVIQPQTLQPPAAAPANTVASMRSRFHWSHAVLAVGLLAVSGAGTALVFKKSVVPRLKSWIRKVVLDEEDESVKKTDPKPSIAEEAAAAAKAAAAAAADVAKASQEMAISKKEEKKYLVELMNMLDMQVLEMKSMSNSIRKLEGETSVFRRTSAIEREDRQLNVINSTRPYVNGKTDYDSRSVRSASPPASTEPSLAPHPKSFMDIVDMVQRGEKPSNIREIDDSPPNPNQQPSNPRLAPRPKPWEVNQSQNYASQVSQYQPSSEGLYTNGQDNGRNYSTNADGPAPWLQRKNPRITELESDDEPKSGSYSSQRDEPPPPPPVRRAWVPPQPPPVAMPEAAEAIRRPKSLARELTDDELLEARSSDGTDELQRITKMSEKGGAVEFNDGSSMLSSSEILEA